MTKDEALRLAFEALEYEAQKGNDNAYQFEREAIKAALEAKDEPVAWGYRDRNGEITDCITPHEHDRAEGDYRIPLYTTPPQRTWVGLTDEEIRLQWSEFWEAECHPWAIEFARAIEAKLKEKNT